MKHLLEKKMNEYHEVLKSKIPNISWKMNVMEQKNLYPLYEKHHFLCCCEINFRFSGYSNSTGNLCELVICEWMYNNNQNLKIRYTPIYNRGKYWKFYEGYSEKEDFLHIDDVIEFYNRYDVKLETIKN